MKKELTENIKKEKVLIGTMLSFVFFISFLYYVDFVPELHLNTINANELSEKDTAKNTLKVKKQSNSLITNDKPVTPTRITIKSIELDTPIIIPRSSDLKDLDRALLSGAIHYPNSALLNQNGNMLLSGHSSYLPVVKNKAFKAFNKINKLKKGDLISVYGEDDKIYKYSVELVTHSKAKDATVNFESEKPMLTLSTCDNFGDKGDRWIVTAKLINVNN
jgi:LPXTG-site transpeptidase (sortase) family protein